MICKGTVNFLVVAAALYFWPSPVFSGGSVFVRTGSSSTVSTGVSVSSYRGGSRASIFIRIGNRWVPTSSNYYVVDQLRPDQSLREEHQLNGTDANGVLYISGYRISTSGWLQLQVEPRDAEVLVDGLPIQLEKASGLSNSLGLLVGKHHVQVRKEGYEAYETDLPIQQAREVLLKIELIK